MTWRQWLMARQLIYEEHMGVLLRSKENAISSEYAQSVARLRAAQAREQEQP